MAAHPVLLRQCSACFTSAKLAALESASQPSMLAAPSATGCACGGAPSVWPAWTAESLAALYPSLSWDLGRADGSRCTLPALVGAASAAATCDASAPPSDEPLYIFDAEFAETAPALATYAGAVPAGFPAEDGHLAHLTTSRALRRPWRWLLVSAPGAGFAVHVDPHGTAAWNALLSGAKRWALLPPATPLDAVLPSMAASARRGDGGAALPPSEATARGWFASVLPGLRARGAELGLLEFRQAPGETLYIPCGWWHAALTEETAVGVTHNFMSSRGFAAVAAQLQLDAASADAAGDAKAAAAARNLAAAWRGRLREAGLEVG
jgi:hypothetical protein